MTSEEWRPVVGFKRYYEVSSLGRVRALPRRMRYLLRNGRPAFRLSKAALLKPQRINSGYLTLQFLVRGKRNVRLVHRLVARAFHGPARGREVDHLNARRTDNRAVNLEWVSLSENRRRAWHRNHP